MKKNKFKSKFLLWSIALLSGSIFHLSAVSSEAKKKINIPLECNSPTAFAKSLKEYYNQVGKKFEDKNAYPAGKMKDMLFGEMQLDQELTLLAVPLLLDEKPELAFSLRGCWVNINEFIALMDAGEWNKATKKFYEWQDCSARLYMKESASEDEVELPSLAAEIKACYDKVKKKFPKEKAHPQISEATPNGPGV